MSKQSYELLPDNPYRSLRIDLHNYMLNLTPFFSPEWFTDAFNKNFRLSMLDFIPMWNIFIYRSLFTICFYYAP